MIDEDKKVHCIHCGGDHEMDEISAAAEEFADTYFEHIWKQGKSDLKDMSKREVAEQMYYLGVKHFMEETHKQFSEMAQEISNKLKK
tara:strand:+ start:193 stop:453 length:261 start_codon:yes stop_codon:yes gene_type:complete